MCRACQLACVVNKLTPYVLPALGLVLVSCEDGFSGGSTSYDPLETAGGLQTGPRVVEGGFRPGEFVRVAVPNSGFFKERPEGEASAEKLLDVDTQLKVISDDGSWVKVEMDTGEVGYVSTVQVLGENESVVMPGLDGGAELYPPTGEIIPLEDPNLPGEELVVPPTIDPDAPVDEPILPDNNPSDDEEGVTPELPDPITPEQLKEAEGDSSTAE